jgi:hypothetical protein
VSTPERDSGCRLAVKRFALGPPGRRFGDSSAEHRLDGSEVGQAGVKGEVIGCHPSPRSRWNTGNDKSLPDDKT